MQEVLENPTATELIIANFIKGRVLLFKSTTTSTSQRNEKIPHLFFNIKVQGQKYYVFHVKKYNFQLGRSLVDIVCVIHGMDVFNNRFIYFLKKNLIPFI